MELVIRASLIGFTAALALGTADAGRAQEQPTAPQGAWSQKAPLPHARNEMQVTAVGGKIFGIGGGDLETYELNLIDVYDPATNSWTRPARMPEGANHSGMTVLDEMIYVAGGFRSNRHTIEKDAFYAYDPASDHWQQLAPLRNARGALVLASVGGKVHAIGGRRMNQVIANHEVYDPATGQWEFAAPFPPHAIMRGSGLYPRVRWAHSG